MKSTELMEAMTDIRSGFLAEALTDEGTGETPFAPEQTVHTPKRSPAAAVIAAAACVALAAGSVALIYKLKGTEPAVVPADSTTAASADTTAESTETTAVRQNRISEEESSTTAGTQERDGTAERKTTAETAETTGTEQSRTTSGTTKSSRTAASKTTGQTAVSTTETQETKSSIRGADPDAVIRQLKTGIADDFEWGYDRDPPEAGCDVHYQSYGVAFLCSDIAKLKTGSIGQYPVFWSDGAWSEYGGTALASDGEKPRGIKSGDCMVQPLSGFLGRFSGDTLTGGLGTDVEFSFRREQQTVFSVLNDYAQYGQTVYMASVSTPLTDTAEGGKAMDYSALIRAIDADDSLTLLGLVYGVERGYGFIEDWAVDLTIRFRQDGYEPDAALFAEYGRFRKSPYTENLWILTVDGAEPHSAQLTPEEQNEQYREYYKKLHRICEELQKACPQIKSVKPDLLYFA